ncbi:MAG TPA: hypothetical protein VEC37_13005 [Bacillota bacterium]|nr:hypothetical protein [Bacillota bacterium]
MLYVKIGVGILVLGSRDCILVYTRVHIRFCTLAHIHTMVRTRGHTQDHILDHTMVHTQVPNPKEVLLLQVETEISMGPLSATVRLVVPADQGLKLPAPLNYWDQSRD